MTNHFPDPMELISDSPYRIEPKPDPLTGLRAALTDAEATIAELRDQLTEAETENTALHELLENAIKVPDMAGWPETDVLSMVEITRANYQAHLLAATGVEFRVMITHIHADEAQRVISTDEPAGNTILHLDKPRRRRQTH